MQRNYLKIGDKSSAGGIVIEEIPATTHLGTGLTFIGAKVSCPACKSTGQIAAKGPRLSFDMMGKKPALEDDICVCKCSPPPVMIASQTTMYETLDGHALASQGYASNGQPVAAASQGSSGITHDQHFRIINSDGEPVEGLPYQLKSSDGQIVKGTTMSNGLTDIVGATDPHQVDFLLHLTGGA